MGELLALKWEDIDFSTAQLHVRRTINRLAKYEAHDGENKTEIVFGTPKTKNSRRTIPLTRTMADELTRWKQQQAHEVRTQGWRDPMSVTLGAWYEYWLDTYMKDTVKQSTYASYRSYLNKHFCVLGKILLKKLEPHTLQEFYNYKFREEGLSPKTLRNY